MEFLKNKWAYVALILALLILIAASAYLLILTRSPEKSQGGMLVWEEEVREAERTAVFPIMYSAAKVPEPAKNGCSFRSLTGGEENSAGRAA